jgi:branched-chain amino acid aminotransferase
MSIVYFKGNYVPLKDANISIMTHAFNYGTGVFEGIKGYYNPKQDQLYVFRIKEHLERMKRNCRILKIYIDQSTEELTELIVKLIRKNKFKTDLYIRPLAYKSSEKVGVKLPEEYDFCIFAVPVSHYFDPSKPIRACLSSWRRIEDNAIPGRGKITGAYVNSALAAQEARDNGFDEAIFLNQDGHVSEGAAMNLFLAKEGMLHTPSVSQNILEGITRNTIIEISREELGIRTMERAVDRTELYTADEVFFCGTLAEVVSVGSIDQRPINSGKMGKITREVIRLFYEMVHGEIEKYKKWLNPVY